MCEVAVGVQNWGHGAADPPPASYKITKNCVNFLDRHSSPWIRKTREGNKNVTAMSAWSDGQMSLVAIRKVANNTKITLKVNSHTFRNVIPKLHILYIV